MRVGGKLSRVNSEQASQGASLRFEEASGRHQSRIPSTFVLPKLSRQRYSDRLLVANYQLEFPFFYFMGAFAGRKIAVVRG